MKILPAWIGIGLVAVFAGTIYAECDYSRVGYKLAQCRPVDLVAGNVIARIVCLCQYAAASAACSAARIERPSVTLQTADILQTCAQGETLCDSACPAKLP